MKQPRSLRSPFFLPVISLILAGCSQAAGGDQATPTPLPTPVRTTYTVQRGDIVIHARLSGQVEPVAISSVTFAMEGHVAHVYVQPNELVTKGQLLADLVELQELEKRAVEIRRAVRKAEIQLEIEKQLLAKYKAEGKPAYDIRIQELQVELAGIALAETLSQYGLDDADNSLDAIDAQLDLARVYAPVDGLIVSVTVPGRVVTTGTTVFVIGDPMQLEVVAVPDRARAGEQFKQMFEGMPAGVTLDARPEIQLTGKVTELPSPYGTGPSSDSIVRVVLDQAPSLETYQSGDKVTVMIELANKKGVLWLPPAAVHQVGGRTFVISDSGSGPQRIEIEIGVQTQDKVEILSGLKEGQVVIGL
ncbi:MAG: efflux RND transporter periplasmic adaptor subunit [Anaerolineales bacterium]|nr:efflux RND transporter periplasmic adaptor subunit [Anaerolineales bacterium]